MQEQVVVFVFAKRDEKSYSTRTQSHNASHLFLLAK